MKSIYRLISKIINRFVLYFHLFKVKIYSRKVLVDFDENWFKGKRVAIIGGADSVLKEPLGHFIDRFDVVVRINKGVEIIDEQKEFVGSRTDFLFHAFFDIAGNKGSSPITPELWKQSKVRHIIFSGNYNISPFSVSKVLNFIKKTNGKVKFSQLRYSQCVENRKVVEPYFPTTGFAAIKTIYDCNPLEIYITGITFMQTQHNNLYRDFTERDVFQVFNSAKDHDANIEFEFIRELYLKKSSKIRTDSVLKDLFESND